MLSRYKIAVIGGGISGIVASHLLSRNHQVVLFEKNNYLGGHTNTIELTSGSDEGLKVDTGFIVLNDKTYPNIHKFFKQLKVKVRDSDMSFGYICEDTGFAYAGRTLSSLFGCRRNIFSPRFYRFLSEIIRFSKTSLEKLDSGELKNISLGELLKEEGFSEDFHKHYLVPMSAAIWSSPDREIAKFPSELFAQFFKNHGLLSLKDRPQWQTVVGGSFDYVKKFAANFSGEVRLSSPVDMVTQLDKEVEVTCGGEMEKFDKVVFASHADQSLKILANPTEKQVGLLSNWKYQTNKVYLHTDISVLPKNKNIWASWNYRRDSSRDESSPVYVTYDMNRLQGINSSKRYLVTLNSAVKIREEHIIREISYEHPQFDMGSLKSQQLLEDINGIGNSYFCGAYLGNGFHEDGAVAGAKVAAYFGESL